MAYYGSSACLFAILLTDVENILRHKFVIMIGTLLSRFIEIRHSNLCLNIDYLFGKISFSIDFRDSHYTRLK